jgi:hypothetical protein
MQFKVKQHQKNYGKYLKYKVLIPEKKMDGQQRAAFAKLIRSRKTLDSIIVFY